VTGVQTCALPISSTGLGVGTPGNDITIQVGSSTPTTISGSALTDPVTETNYAAKVAGLFNVPGTGLVATVGAATTDLGSLGLTDFVDGEDSYTLNISSGSGSTPTVSVTLDGPSGSYDFTLEGLAAALGASGATNVTATSGTLANGVSYDISSGSLVLTGPADGSEIDLSEVISNPDLTPPSPSGGIGGSQTAYGQLTLTTNTTEDVTLSGAGLTDIGLTADTLDGSSGRVDIFSVLTRLEESLRAGNIDDPAGPGGSIQTQIANLEVAADQERSMRATLGARAQRVYTAITHQEDAQVDLKAILSRYQDVDMVEVYNDIVQKETAFEAALNVTARISQISILDYFSSWGTIALFRFQFFLIYYLMELDNAGSNQKNW
jgi:flagellar hook-associated protein 3 FlgL